MPPSFEASILLSAQRPFPLAGRLGTSELAGPVGNGTAFAGGEIAQLGRRGASSERPGAPPTGLPG